MSYSSSLIARCKDAAVNPKIKFTYNTIDYSNRLLSVGEIRRDWNLGPGSATVMLDNKDGTFDTLLTGHTELTKKCAIKMSFGGFASYINDTISFHEANPDYLEDAESKFLDMGFASGMVFGVTNSHYNNGFYTINSVTNDRITLISADDLVPETAGYNLTLASEEIALFTGYVEVADMDYVTKRITLTLRDRISRCLENQVQYVVDDQIIGVYYNFLYYNWTKIYDRVISDTVWSLLVSYANLHNLASPSNSDIDYQSWLDWAVAVDNGGYAIYDIGVVAKGQTVSSILMRILQLTESIAWVGADGKLKFKASTQSKAGQTYTKDEVCSPFNWNVSLEGRVNSINVKWGYAMVYDAFLSDYSTIYYHSHIVGPTSTAYIYQLEYEEDRVVFHNTYESAEIYATEKFVRTAPPTRIFNFNTMMLGFLEDVGNEIYLDDFYVAVPHDHIEIYIQGIAFDISRWQANIQGQYQWGSGELL